ncbi:MAG: hypothetical protein O7G83_14105 [Proteobacteria bacterium]|nr:hypothetical protein [Pseudomonadota bacterium]
MSEVRGEIVGYEGAVLGATAAPLTFDDHESLAVMIVTMARQCRQSLMIVSRHLDPAIYDNDAFVEALKNVALNNRTAQIRLFIVESRPLISTGHRVLELSSRLPSYIEIRAPAPQHKQFNEAILVADNTGYIHRQFSDRFEGTADFNDRRIATGLADRIEEMWERGVPDTNFRRLHI